MDTMVLFLFHLHTPCARVFPFHTSTLKALQQLSVQFHENQLLYVVIQRFWASDMFDDFLVGKGLAEHGILEQSEKE